MSAPFTPGPWHISAVEYGPGARNLIGLVPTVEMSGPCHAIVASLGAKKEEVAATARLIRAAPDLYAALRALFASYKALADSGDAGFWQIEDTPEGKQALAALAKIEEGT